MKYFSLEQLAEGIRERHIGAERARLVEKWAPSGLLRGLTGRPRENMAQILENQAVQVLKEGLGAGSRPPPADARRAERSLRTSAGRGDRGGGAGGGGGMDGPPAALQPGGRPR